MRVLMSVMPFAGHVRPITHLVSTLIDRGHTVTVYTGARYRGQVERTGARMLPWHDAHDYDEHRVRDFFPEAGRSGFRGMLGNVVHVFLGTAAGQARDLVRELDGPAGPYDVVAGDTLSFGIGLAAELRPLPCASISIVPNSHPGRQVPPMGLRLGPARGPAGELRNRVLWRGMEVPLTALKRAYRQARHDVGLDPNRRIELSATTGDLVLLTGPPRLDHDRTDLPERFHYVGRLGDPDRPPRPAVRTSPPHILVTQGTYHTDPGDLLIPTIRALTGRPVRVTVTTGRRGDTDLGIPVPANVMVVDYADFADLLPRTAVLVTNGGWGGVLDALAAGVPLVVAGGELDKPEIAARVARSRVGVDLRTGRPRPRAVRRAVLRALTDPVIADQARACAGELARLGGSVRAAQLIEELVGDPISRRESRHSPPGR